MDKIVFRAPDWMEEMEKYEPPSHEILLTRLLQQIERVDFRKLAGFDSTEEKLHQKHFLIIIIEHVLQIARLNNWGLCIMDGSVYIYNGTHWQPLSDAELQSFLGQAAERMGADKFTARFHRFRDQLSKQFVATANLPKPHAHSEVVLLNLLNGTMEVSLQTQKLRPPEHEDFLTHILPFEYNAHAKAPMFQKFLDRVQPNPDNQKILSEFVAYLFVSPKVLKLEKALLLYGCGANGKSVFFEIITALLGGSANVSNYSLSSLTDTAGYYRAKLADKLLNYASEINGKLEASIFKQLVSNEPVEARLPYGEPLVLLKYAKLIFNCNELPKDTEQTHAFFRRLLIVPFDEIIPDQEQDKALATKIIENELSGILNWVLEGLNRLLENRNFTHSESVREQIEQYKLQSDSVKLFLSETGCKQSESSIPLKLFFSAYRTFCGQCGYYPASLRTFGDRLRNAGFVIIRKSYGNAVCVEMENDDDLPLL